MCCPDGQLFRYSQNRERIHKLLKIDKKFRKLHQKIFVNIGYLRY